MWSLQVFALYIIIIIYIQLWVQIKLIKYVCDKISGISSPKLICKALWIFRVMWTANTRNIIYTIIYWIWVVMGHIVRDPKMWACRCRGYAKVFNCSLREQSKASTCYPIGYISLFPCSGVLYSLTI